MAVAAQRASYNHTGVYHETCTAFSDDSTGRPGRRRIPIRHCGIGRGTALRRGPAAGLYFGEERRRLREGRRGVSDGELTVKVYPLSLLNFAETSASVRDGIADIAYPLAPYFPSEYPHFNMIAGASVMLNLMGGEVRGREGR